MLNMFKLICKIYAIMSDFVISLTISFYEFELLICNLRKDFTILIFHRVWYFCYFTFSDIVKSLE